ncbi:MAG TPA: DUF928 domain-containing protein [Thermosynechococcaceae cyanobacterium]
MITNSVLIAALAGIWATELVLSSGVSATQSTSIVPAQKSALEVSLDFNPPNRGAPQTTTGGASRSNCVRGNPPLTLLVPADKTGQFGLTTLARPTLLVYVPRTTARSAEFLLKVKSGNQPEGKEIYRTTVKVSGKAGVVSLSLPESAPGLEVGKDYQWYFSLICNPEDRLSDVFANAWISRTQPSSKLATALKQASPRDRPALYSASSYWYDPLASLAELRRRNPQDAALVQDWGQLLRGVGLKEVAPQPLLLQPSGNPTAATPR